MKNHRLRVKCEVCQAEISPNIITRHIRDVHAKERKFQCEICTRSYKSTTALGIHRKSHNKKFECKTCKRMFSTQSFLNQHNRTHHENPKIFKCEICNKQFNLKLHFQRHQKIHDKNRPKPFKCQRCDYATHTRQSHEAHQNVHKRQDEKFAAMKNPLKCEKCPAFCRNKHFLRHHMKVVHPEVLHQCDLCGMYLKTKVILKTHLLLHLKKLKY